MGMYSSLADQDVIIKDVDGLRKYLEDLEKNNIKEYQGMKDGPAGWASELKIEEQNSQCFLDFSGWDGYKIISYWYDSLLYLLRDLAVYCEGHVYLDFENQDEAGRWEFRDGKCIVTTGQMRWQSWEPLDTIRQKIDMPEIVKEHLAIRNL